MGILSAIDRRRRAQGFTLLELLIAIAIMVVVIAIALPTYKGAVSFSKQSTCTGQMRSIGVALVGYASDHQGWLPPLRRDYSPPLDGRYPALFWTSLISPYLQKGYVEQAGQTFMRCPERPKHSVNQDPTNNYTYGLTYAKACGYDSVLDGELIRAGAYSTPGRILPLRELAGTYILADSHGVSSPFTEWPHPSGWYGVRADRNKIAFVHGGTDENARANFMLGDGSIRSLSVAEWSVDRHGIWGTPWP